MSEIKREFKFKDKIYVVKKPTMKINSDAQKVYNKTFAEALEAKCIIREKLDDVLRSQGLWNDMKEQQYQTLRREILDLELSLKRGGIKLVKAKKIAQKIKEKRLDIMDLLSARSRLDSHTAEGQADNMRFNYLVSACLVYNETGKCYFSSLESYMDKADEDLSELAAKELYLLLFDQNDSAEKELTENKFLVRFGFMNADLEWINKDGNLIDEDGRLIDAEGRFLDKEGNFVDINGNPVTEDGEYVVDEKPFLDETGKPILLV